MAQMLPQMMGRDLWPRVPVLTDADVSRYTIMMISIVEAPEGTQVAVFDVKLAFHNVSIHPSARLFMAVQLRKKIHLDPCLNFRVSPAPGIWERIVDTDENITTSRHGSITKMNR